MTSLGRAARRGIAFLLDVVFLTFFTTPAVLAALVLGLEPSLELTTLVVVGYGVYFVGCEVLADGQTIGKRLMRLRLVAVHERAVTIYAATLRYLLIALAPMACYTAAVLLDTLLYLRPPVDFVIASVLFHAGLLIWPISVLFGRGQVGLHDLVAKTEVVLRTDASSQVLPVRHRFVELSLLATGLASAVVAYTFGEGLVEMERVGTEEPREIRREVQGGRATVELSLVTRGTSDLRTWISDVHSYITGPAIMSREECSEEWTFTFQGSVFRELPDTLRATEVAKTCVKIEIPTTVKGILASDFRTKVERELAGRLWSELGPSVAVASLMVFEYRASTGFFWFMADVTLRRVGLWSVDGEQIVFQTVTPDESTELYWGVSLGFPWIWE